MFELDLQALTSHQCLKELCDYSVETLLAESLKPSSLYPRNSYLNSLFIMSTAFTDGIVRLSEQGQLRASIPLIRSAYEAWVNAKFIYSSRSHVWAYYLLLNGEKVRIEKLKHLMANGDTSEQDYTGKVNEARRIIRQIKSRYKSLPVIPNLITNNLDIEYRTLNKALGLRQKCQIIDFYSLERNNKNSPDPQSLMVTNYDWVYGHLSGVSHLDPLALNDLYDRDSDGNWHVDISGGEDRAYLIKLINIAYMIQYELLKSYKRYLPVENRMIPHDLTVTFRNMSK